MILPTVRIGDILRVDHKQATYDSDHQDGGACVPHFDFYCFTVHDFQS